MAGMDRKGGLAAAIAIVMLLAFIGIVCWAGIGSYLEVQASKRDSQERMQRVARETEERERRDSADPSSEPEEKP